MIMDNHISTTIIHQAITSTGDTAVRSEVISTILRQTPVAAAIKNGFGSLPLHVIAQRNIKMDAQTKECLILELMGSNKDALTDGGGISKRTPLHILFTDYVSPRLTSMMIENGRAACFIKDRNGYLPVHVACCRHCSPEKLQMLLNVNPRSLFDKTNQGETILDLAKKTATKAHPNYALIIELHHQLDSTPHVGQTQQAPQATAPPPAEEQQPVPTPGGGAPAPVSSPLAPAQAPAALYYQPQQPAFAYLHYPQIPPPPLLHQVTPYLPRQYPPLFPGAPPPPHMASTIPPMTPSPTVAVTTTGTYLPAPVGAPPAQLQAVSASAAPECLGLPVSPSGPQHEQQILPVSIEDDNHLVRCPQCKVNFATDTTLNQNVPLPISCGKCGGYTLCLMCVSSLNQEAQCPACKQLGGFDSPVPNVAFCRVLDQLSRLSSVSGPESNRLTPPEETRSMAVESFHEPTIPQSVVCPVKQESSESKLLELGERVDCLWPEDQLYYPGVVASIHWGKKKRARYTIHFDDGDRRSRVERKDIYTSAESACELVRPPSPRPDQINSNNTSIEL